MTSQVSVDLALAVVARCEQLMDCYRRSPEYGMCSNLRFHDDSTDTAVEWRIQQEGARGAYGKALSMAFSTWSEFSGNVDFPCSDLKEYFATSDQWNPATEVGMKRLRLTAHVQAYFQRIADEVQ